MKWEEKQKYPSKCAASVDLFWLRKLSLLAVITCVISVHHCSFINICLVKTPLISLFERNAVNSGAVWGKKKKRVQQLSFCVETKHFVSYGKSHLLPNVAPTLQQSGCGSITATRLAQRPKTLPLCPLRARDPPPRSRARRAGSYPAGERHHVVRIPAAVQADAEAHPGQSHHPTLHFHTADGKEQTEQTQRRKTFEKKKKKSGLLKKSGKHVRIWQLYGKAARTTAGPDGADISTQLRASWHWAYESSAGTESEWQWRTCTYCTARCQHSSFTCRKLSSSAAHPRCPFKKHRLLQKRG